MLQNNIVSHFVNLCVLDIFYILFLFYFQFMFRFRYPAEISNRMTCMTHLSYIVLYGIRNIFKEPWHLLPTHHTQLLKHQMISYFLYDLLIMFSTSRGRSQFVFIIHHFISLLFIIANLIQPCGDNIMTNSLLVLLEMASPLLHLTKITQELYPRSYLYHLVHYMTIFLYATTRVYGFGTYIYVYLSHYFDYTLYHGITLSSILLIFYASIKWTVMMINKQV